MTAEFRLQMFGGRRLPLQPSGQEFNYYGANAGFNVEADA